MAAIEQRLAENLSHPFLRHVVANALRHPPTISAPRPSTPSTSDIRMFWCVLELHPIFHGFREVIECLNSGYEKALLDIAFGCSCKLKLAWRINPSHSIFSVVRNAFQHQGVT